MKMDEEKYDFVLKLFMQMGSDADEKGLDPSEFFSYVSAIMVAIALANGGKSSVERLTEGMLEYGMELYKNNAEHFAGKEEDDDGPRTIH